MCERCITFITIHLLLLLKVPVGFRRIAIFDSEIPLQTFCHIVRNDELKEVYDITLMDPEGKILLFMEQYETTRLGSLRTETSIDDMSYEIQWMEQALVKPETQTDLSNLVRTHFLEENL